MDTRAVKTTDKATGIQRHILLVGDAKLAGLVAAISTAHGLVAEALSAALAQVQAGETFRVFVRSGENIVINTPSVLTRDGQNETEKWLIPGGYYRISRATLGDN
ncbi:MAG: hypothetical protein EZS28_049374 [Streblomastix strix]|uniref:Uncharacterized protein n=1 Tax=Streblomastix strix TaxID=222440 RepID=A0A5J4TC46_9EUKA|nr:MAG: hypothetical protein EZS28_049374 [Streblomastix strix]